MAGTCYASLIHSRDDAVTDPSAIKIPVLAVAHRAHVVVAPLAVDKKNREINDVEIGQRAFEQARQAPSQTHEQIAEIVHVTCDPPPAGRYQQRAARGLDVLGRPTPDHLPRILAELVLLDVGAAENNVADRI